MSDRPATALPPFPARWAVALFALICLAGTAVRLGESGSWRRTGFDEMIYRRYVNLMDGGVHIVGIFQRDETMEPFRVEVRGRGVGAMPDLCGLFLDSQALAETHCELPPTRFLYIYLSWLWKRVQFGDAPPLPAAEIQPRKLPPDRSMDADHRDPALVSLHRVARLFSILLMAAGGIVAWRMAGPGIGLSVLALMAFSPMQIHFSQHALIDGFFAFWALLCFWTTWECLRAPTSRGWPVAHGILLAILPVAKLENAFFVCCGLGGILAGNRWLKIGAISPRLLLASILGPAAGILFLVALAGGADTFVAIYKVLVAKAGDLPYAQLTGDGPWYRYLIDMMTLSPLVVLLAVGGVFRLGGRRKEIVFAAAFVAASYAVMCNVRYGMNLRYTSIWEMPFRLCAAALVADLCARFRGRGWLAAALAVAALCAYDLRQYRIFSGDPSIPLYELVTNDLLRLVRILKSPSDFGL